MYMCVYMYVYVYIYVYMNILNNANIRLLIIYMTHKYVRNDEEQR